MRKWSLIIATGFIGIFLMGQTPALAETREPLDTELWTSLEVRFKISKKFSATFAQRFRLDENISRRYLDSPEFSLRYKLSKSWQLEGGWRYEYELDNDSDFQSRYRIFANTRFLLKYRPATFEVRLQWQEQLRSKWDDGTPTRHFLRARLKAKLRTISFVNPYASIELFQRLDGSDPDISAGTIRKVRFGLGTEWDTGPVEFNFQYYLVRPTDDPEEPLRHILGVGVRFDWDPFRN